MLSLLILVVWGGISWSVRISGSLVHSFNWLQLLLETASKGIPNHMKAPSLTETTSSGMSFEKVLGSTVFNSIFPPPPRLGAAVWNIYKTKQMHSFSPFFFISLHSVWQSHFKVAVFRCTKEQCRMLSSIKGCCISLPAVFLNSNLKILLVFLGLRTQSAIQYRII